MKEYFGKYWIINIIVIGVLISLARYWYGISVQCMDAMNNQPPIVLNDPSGKGRAIIN